MTISVKCLWKKKDMTKQEFIDKLSQKILKNNFIDSVSESVNIKADGNQESDVPPCFGVRS